MPRAISLNTPIEDLHDFRIARLGEQLSHKLAIALAAHANKRNAAEVNVEDLLNYLPMRYEDRSHPAAISDLTDQMEASLELLVLRAHGYEIRKGYGRGRLFIFEVKAYDAGKTGREVIVWWFVSGRRAYEIVKYYTQKLAPETRFITFGRWEWNQAKSTYKLQLHRPADELEILPSTEQQQSEIAEGGVDLEHSEENISDPSLAAIHVGRRVPVYRKLGPFNSKRVREIIHAVLANLDPETIEETLPPDLIQSVPPRGSGWVEQTHSTHPLPRGGTDKKRIKLIDRSRALHEIHFPPADASMEDYELSRSPAHTRMIFEDFFWVTFALGLKRGRRTKEAKNATLRIGKAEYNKIAGVLPFKLTEAQRRVTREIFADMKSNAPMNRLLQGDVGSGKTIIAVIAMIAAMENNLQTALMAPTEILAEQHARNIKRLLARTPYRVELLTGSLRATDKRRLRVALQEGEIHAVIGTHALVQEGVAFDRLGLVVIDEQHRFGVMQRAELRARGFNPDVLVMTATPIPRSLAMTVYGDLDVSVIDELPPGRTPIETIVAGEDQRQEVKRLISREVKAGHQIYVVYPLVEESEKMDLKDATRRYEYLRDVVFPRLPIGLLHGKMKPAAKETVMNAFAAGDIKILVSTTVIEVGVDVPNASVMIVEHAERFGLSQLHQLRGRVGRGAKKSYCVLLTSDKKTAVAEERLGIMAKTTDGFVIAEKDLDIRGPGELLGTRQSGLPELRVGNIVRDRELLELAKCEAESYLAKEKSPVTAKLIARVKQDTRFEIAAVG